MPNFNVFFYKIDQVGFREKKKKNITTIIK